MEIYKNKTLGIAHYGIRYQFTISDFLNKEKLLHFLYELDCGEVSLTKTGFKFLEEYYGLNRIVQLIMDEVSQGVDYKYTTKNDLLNWLHEMNKLAVEVY